MPMHGSQSSYTASLVQLSNITTPTVPRTGEPDLPAPPIPVRSKDDAAEDVSVSEDEEEGPIAVPRDGEHDVDSMAKDQLGFEALTYNPFRPTRRSRRADDQARSDPSRVNKEKTQPSTSAKKREYKYGFEVPKSWTEILVLLISLLAILHGKMPSLKRLVL